MGKRELLLAAVFAIVGVAVYQFTKPPGDPTKPGFSLSRVMNEIRREIRGQREFAEGTRTNTISVPESVREVRLDELLSTAVTVIGEERQDIEAEFHVRSNGYDVAEARRLVDESRLLSDEAGGLLILTTKYPVEGRQTGRLTLKVPSRLGLRLDGKSGVMKLSNLASVAIGTARGETTITGIRGHVSLVQRSSQLTIDDVGSVRLQTGAGAEVRLTNVRGDTALNVQGGDLRASQLGGALEVESRAAELHFEQIEKLRGPVRINAVLGELSVKGLRTEARIDGRETEMLVEAAAAVPLGIYTTGERVELVLPPEGLDLDVVAIDGSVTLDDALRKGPLNVTPDYEQSQPTGSRREQRVTGALRGGGPTITVRATRGDIVLKSR